MKLNSMKDICLNTMISLDTRANAPCINFFVIFFYEDIRATPLD